MEATADLEDNKPDEETCGDAEKEQGQPSMETTPNPHELPKPDEESILTDAVAKTEKEEGEQEQLMELPPGPDPDKSNLEENGQITNDASSGGGEQKAAVGDGVGGGEGEEREEGEGEGEVSRESGGLQLESGPIEVDVLLHAEEDDLSVFSAEAAEADKALTSNFSSSSRSGSRKKPQSSSSASASSSSSRQRRLSKSSSSALVGSPSLGEVAKASSSTGPGGASSAVCSTASSGSSGVARRVSISSSSGTEANSGGGEKRPRSDKSEVRNVIVCINLC
jgi:hypothetical protein